MTPEEEDKHEAAEDEIAALFEKTMANIDREVRDSTVPLGLVEIFRYEILNTFTRTNSYFKSSGACHLDVLRAHEMVFRHLASMSKKQAEALEKVHDKCPGDEEGSDG